MINFADKKKRLFRVNYKYKIEQMDNYVREMESILVFKYHFTKGKKLDEKLFSQFQVDNEFQELDEAFNSLLTQAYNAGYEDDTNIRELLNIYVSIQDSVDSMDPRNSERINGNIDILVREDESRNYESEDDQDDVFRDPSNYDLDMLEGGRG